MPSETVEAVNAILAQQRAGIHAVMKQLADGDYPWWVPDNAKGKAFDYFAYTAEWLPLLPNQSASRIVQMENDSAFVIMSTVLVETSEDDLTNLAFRPLLSNIKALQSGRTLSDNPVHVDNWYGTAENPNYWDFPKILTPSTAIQVTMSNLEATARNVRLAFRGIKIFKYEPSAGE